MIEVDGGYLAGGGQILRTAVGLSAATGQACRVFDIRKGRRKPGLAAQHLKGVKAVARTCEAELTGVRLGSKEILFVPGELNPPRQISVEVGTAGSVTLILQALMVPLAVCDRSVEVSVSGGTHVKWAPTTDYFGEVLCWFMRRLGTEIAVVEVHPGFYPKGGGRIALEVRSGKLRPLSLTTRGEALGANARSIASVELQQAEVAERQLRGVRRVLDVDRESVEYVASTSVGTAVLARADFENCRLGASALGERGKAAEEVGAQAARRLQEQVRSGACLDEHMADQILPYLALAGAESEISVAAVSDHCRTNVRVIEQFLPVRFDVDEGAGRIRCQSA